MDSDIDYVGTIDVTPKPIQQISFVVGEFDDTSTIADEEARWYAAAEKRVLDRKRGAAVAANAVAVTANNNNNEANNKKKLADVEEGKETESKAVEESAGAAPAKGEGASAESSSSAAEELEEGNNKGGLLKSLCTQKRIFQVIALAIILSAAGYFVYWVISKPKPPPETDFTVTDDRFDPDFSPIDYDDDEPGRPSLAPSSFAPTREFIDVPDYNLARGKSSRASSANQPSRQAFDGNSDTRWQSYSFDDNEFIEVDLGEVYQLSRVVIQWEYASAQSYDIQASMDGKDYITLWSTNNGYEGMGAVESLLDGDSLGKYVRMQGYQRATNWGYSIWEMEVYGRGPISIGAMGDNIAEGKESTASSELNTLSSTMTSDNAFDGDPETRWQSSDPGSDEEWLEVDLRSVHLLSKVTISWGEDAGVKSYEIWVSTDGSSYTNLWRKDDGFVGMGTVESLLGEGQFGRYVRMQGVERTTDGAYGILEMQVF